jgi:hypothetical protein
MIVDPFERRFSVLFRFWPLVEGIHEDHGRLADLLQRQRRQMEGNVISAWYSAGLGSHDKLFGILKARLDGGHNLFHPFHV